MKKYLITIIAFIIVFVSAGTSSHAQQYKLRQSKDMMGMKNETTIYVKGMRKRTEGGAMMGMGANIITIEQCDSQRTIKINDKKKLYYIEPFSQQEEEVIDDDAAPKKPAPQVKQTKSDPEIKKGGTITTWYSIVDTGERKKMYGFTARHMWTTNKMKPSADACYMKDSMLIKTDGWYIDLPQFNCPVHYSRPVTRQQSERPKPDCKDRYISHRRGKGKLGFPLIETTTMIMGGQASEMKTSIETMELSVVKLDSMLFEIPPGYKETKNEEDLQDKMDASEMMKQYMNQAKENKDVKSATEEKKAGTIRIGVFAPTGDEQVQPSILQEHMVQTLMSGNVEAVAVNSEEDVRKYKCDYTLSTQFTKIKSGSKVGGLIKALKNADPNAASSFNIQAGMTLKAVADGTIRSQPKIDGKYEGKADEAAGKALDEGCRDVLKALK